jgi:hypothetical protein
VPSTTPYRFLPPNPLPALFFLPSLFLLTAAEHPPAPVVKSQGFLPFSDAPIHYRTSKTLNDQITRLNAQLDRGEAVLQYEPGNGYLRSLLNLLNVPVSSQTLVYSKTSLQFQHISPRSPRALYFNDNVYIGQVPNSKSLELIAFDANQGAVFYVLSEHQTPAPRLERAHMDCVQCHIAAATRRIPGVMVRSVSTNANGNAKGGAPVYTVGHETPFHQRFGGWFVTGNAEAFSPRIPSADSSVAARYLSPHSDILAHLVLAHQTQMHNLITELNYRFRLTLHAERQRSGNPSLSAEQLPPLARQQYESVADDALRYLLFLSETPLPSPVHGDSTFQRDFANLGPRDRHQRSLRDFDLQTRIFRHRLSYLIYSDAFDALPSPARDYLLDRLFRVLTGADQSPEFATLTALERRNIFEILVDTKPGLPREWYSHPESPSDPRPVADRSTPVPIPALH